MAEFRLVRTSPGHPEAYDIFRGGEKGRCGYLRYKHGTFDATVIRWVDGRPYEEVVWQVGIDGVAGAELHGPCRNRLLDMGVRAIKAWLDEDEGLIYEMGTGNG